ncbi:Heparanase-like protein [Arachis hypogaea]|nr:Heparanase-like protein [Arachis hypogaea]
MDVNQYVKVALFLSLLVLFCPSFSSSEDVKLKVKGVTNIATTDENFICATLDWWPSDKCDYNQCPWGKAGILNLDLNNTILSNAIKAFNPLRIRLGGSLEDQIIYQFGKQKHCPTMKKKDNGFIKFTFGLNALIGKKNSKEDQLNWKGDWNPNNAISLMKYTVSKGYNIDSYELGNELCSEGVSARLDSVQYAKDITKLRHIVNSLYPNATTRPKVLGPAGFYGKEWFDSFLQHVGPGVIDGVTHHIYNLGAGVDKDLISKVQDPYFLSKIAQTFKDVSTAVKEFTPWAGAWVGESGGAYNSGGKDVSHTFVKSGITLLLINMENSTSFDVSLVNDMNLYPEESASEGINTANLMDSLKREEYHLTPKDGNIQSDVVLLNGTPLELTKSKEIPELKPKIVDASSSSPIKVAPHSIVFVQINNFNAPACAPPTK